MLQESLAGSKLVWLRIVGKLGEKYSLAPRSIITADQSLAELRRAATRLKRLKYHVESPETDSPPHISSSVKLNFPSEIKRPHPQPPTLLPGGRWLLSFVESRETNRTYLLCFDLSLANRESHLPVLPHGFVHNLTPIAQTSFAGEPSFWEAHRIQLDADGDAVNIAVLFTDDLVC